MGGKGGWARFVTCGHLLFTNHCCCTVMNVSYFMAHKEVTFAKISNNACSFFFWGMVTILLFITVLYMHAVTHPVDGYSCSVSSKFGKHQSTCFVHVSGSVFSSPRSAIYYSHHQCRDVILAVYIYVQDFVIVLFSQDVIILLFAYFW